MSIYIRKRWYIYGVFFIPNAREREKGSSNKRSRRLTEGYLRSVIAGERGKPRANSRSGLCIYIYKIAEVIIYQGASIWRSGYKVRGSDDLGEESVPWFLFVLPSGGYIVFFPRESRLVAVVILSTTMMLGLWKLCKKNFAIVNRDGESPNNACVFHSFSRDNRKSPRAETQLGSIILFQ